MDTQNLTAYDNESYMRFTNPGLVHKDLETLCGIITGIIGDHKITVQEHEGLLQWMQAARRALSDCT